MEIITEAMLNDPKFFAPVGALVKSEHNRSTTELAKNDAGYRQFLKLGARSDRYIRAHMSEQGKEPLADMFDDAKTNHWAYSLPS